MRRSAGVDSSHKVLVVPRLRQRATLFELLIEEPTSLFPLLVADRLCSVLRNQVGGCRDLRESFVPSHETEYPMETNLFSR